MLQFDWPSQWSPEVLESIKRSVQSALRKAMGQSSNGQIRGSVVVEDLNFGSSPPKIALSSIRDLTPQHTAVVLSVKYEGDAYITLKGLQINLDTTPVVNDRGEDANHAVPFYCPFQMKLHDLRINGSVLVEFSQEAVTVTSSPLVAMVNNNGGTPVMSASGTPPTAPMVSATNVAESHHVAPVFLSAPPPMVDSHHHHHQGTSVHAASSSSGAVRAGLVLPYHIACASTKTSTWSSSTAPGMFIPACAGNSSPPALTPRERGSSNVPGSFARPPPSANTSMVSRAAFRPTAGVGLLFGAGGRRSMRHPDSTTSEAASPSTISGALTETASWSNPASLIRGNGAAATLSEARGVVLGNTAESLPSTSMSFENNNGSSSSGALRSSSLQAQQHGRAPSVGNGPASLGSSLPAPAVSNANKGAAGIDGIAGSSHHSPPHQLSQARAEGFSVFDMVRHKVKVCRRLLHIQLIGDPIEHFQVESNFAPVQGANQKIEAQLRNLLSPAIERLKTTGLEIVL